MSRAPSLLPRKGCHLHLALARTGWPCNSTIGNALAGGLTRQMSGKVAVPGVAIGRDDIVLNWNLTLASRFEALPEAGRPSFLRFGPSAVGGLLTPAGPMRLGSGLLNRVPKAARLSLTAARRGIAPLRSCMESLCAMKHVMILQNDHLQVSPVLIAMDVIAMNHPMETLSPGARCQCCRPSRLSSQGHV